MDGSWSVQMAAISQGGANGRTDITEIVSKCYTYGATDI